MLCANVVTGPLTGTAGLAADRQAANRSSARRRRAIPLGRESLQARYPAGRRGQNQILRRDFRTITAFLAQNCQHVEPRGFIVELLEQHGFLFLQDFGPEQRVQQMLRAQILNPGLLLLNSLSHITHKELVFGRHRNAECFAVAGHVEHRRADHRRLPDYANACGSRREQKRFDLVIFLDDPTIYFEPVVGFSTTVAFTVLMFWA